MATHVFAGVTSQTTLMSVKVCSVVGGCNGVTQGILYAIDNGADIGQVVNATRGMSTTATRKRVKTRGQERAMAPTQGVLPGQP